jgi:hypothetical protein
MGMMQTLEVLNGMVSDGVISNYAVGGAVAAYNYVEATVTEDLDILVSLETADHRRRSDLITLEPILTYLAAKGYTDFRKEGLIVEGWPVQFLPVADDLDAKALEAAEEVEVTISPEQGSVLTRVLRPEHIVATALRVGRPKARSRILQFIEEDAVDHEMLCGVLLRHHLMEAWQSFCAVTGIENKCGVSSEDP